MVKRRSIRPRGQSGAKKSGHEKTVSQREQNALEKASLRMVADWLEAEPSKTQAVAGKAKMKPQVLTGLMADVDGIPEVGTDAIAEAVRDTGQQQGTLFENIYDDFDGKGRKGQADVYNTMSCDTRPNMSWQVGRVGRCQCDSLTNGDSKRAP